MNYITVDGGTTNTRISVVSDGRLIRTQKYAVGAGSEGAGDIRVVLKNGIADALEATGLSEADIERVLVSGSITSETGLVSLRHITAPCGIAELSRGLCFMELGDITPIGFALLPGVRTVGEDFRATDMMRGEEAELFGICDELRADTLYVLPGSHSKHITVDESGRIDGISTELTGELIAAVSRHTLLRVSVDLENAAISPEYLKKGYEYAVKNGITSAFFKTRVAGVVFGLGRDELASFFIGAALSDELQNIKKSPKKRVVIGGRYELKQPMTILLRAYTDKEVTPLPDAVTENAAAYGIVKIYEHTSEQA